MSRGRNVSAAAISNPAAPASRSIFSRGVYSDSVSPGVLTGWGSIAHHRGPGFEAGSYGLEHVHGPRQVMIGIDHENKVQRGFGEERIVDAPEDRLDVAQPVLAAALANHGQAVLVDVVGINMAGRSHPGGQVDRITAPAGADFADDHAGLQADGVHDLGRRLAIVHPFFPGLDGLGVEPRCGRSQNGRRREHTSHKNW